MNKDNTPAAGAAGVFISTISNMNEGGVLRDLDDAIRDCTRAALQSSAKAKVTLELTVIPNGFGIGDTPLIKIVDKIKTSLPKPARDKAPVFFADENFNPSRRGPNQEALKLTEITGDNGPMGVEAAKKALAQ